MSYTLICCSVLILSCRISAIFGQKKKNAKYLAFCFSTTEMDVSISE